MNPSSFPFGLRRWHIGLVAGCLLLVAGPAWSYQELVVVRKTGQVTRHVSQAKLAINAKAACADQSVAFAFTVAPTDGQTSVELQQGVDGSRAFPITATLGCSSIEGTALLGFDAADGTARRGTDYASTPGSVTFPLTSEGNGTETATTSVTVQLLGNGAPGTRTLSIVRGEGSFQGVDPASGQVVIGSIPGSSDAIVAVTIRSRATINEGAEGVPEIDPAAGSIGEATTAFCATGAGGSGSIGCGVTQAAADLVADPTTPADQREAANAVLENNLLAIAPDESTALAFVAPILAEGQYDNLAGRLAEMRTGNPAGTVSANGLTFVSHGIPVSFGSFASLLNADEDEDSARNEERRTLLGGTRLGLWVSGTLGSSESKRRRGNSGFESDMWDLTGGVDYRFTDQFFAGVAVGHSDMNADYANDQGSLDAKTNSLHVYSGYALPHGFSLDASVSYLRGSYEQDRVIELYELNPEGTGFVSLGRQIASSEPDVSQYGANIGLTYTLMRGTWTFAPQAQYSYLRTRYDAFTESGPSEFNLAYAERNNSSNSFSVGAYMDRTFATSVGAFRPFLRAYFYADSGNSADLVARFAAAGDDGSTTPLSISMTEPDRRYGTAELGMAFSRPIGSRTVDFNFGYLQLLGFDSLDRWSVRFDVRLPL